MTDHVSVYHVTAPEDARSFIGLSHINGVAKWESYAKAKLAADWYCGSGVSHADIADRISDNHDTINSVVQNSTTSRFNVILPLVWSCPRTWCRSCWSLC